MATSRTEIEYQQHLAVYLSFLKDHKDCESKTYDASDRLVRCITCQETYIESLDPDEELFSSRLDNEMQHNPCKACGSDEIASLDNDDLCQSCRAENHVYDFEFGEARAVNQWKDF